MSASTQEMAACGGSIVLSEEECSGGALSRSHRAMAEMLLAYRGYVLLRGALPLGLLRDASGDGGKLVVHRHLRNEAATRVELRKGAPTSMCPRLD